MLTLTGWMQYQFLGGVLKALESGYLIFLFPIVMQVLRFVTGFLSASFFKKGSWFFGIIVLLFSIWLSVYEYNEVDKMAAYWSNLDISTRPLNHSPEAIAITKDSITGIMTILIWGALILEFFLAAWLGSISKTTDIEYEENIIEVPKRTEIDNKELIGQEIKKALLELNVHSKIGVPIKPKKEIANLNDFSQNGKAGKGSTTLS